MRKPKIMSEIFRDRDYIKDVKGDIYQVIGSIHPRDKVLALQKYQKVDETQTPQEHKEYIPEDILSAVKNHPMRYWVENNTENRYIRILPNYSSESAQINISNHPYMSHSSVFNMGLIQIPKENIQTHYNPQKRFQELLDTISKGTMEEKRSLDALERETIEIGYLLEDFFKIDLNNVGITGSLLWHAHHEQSDIDLMIYGNLNRKRIVNKGSQISREGSRLRQYMKIEILPMAQKLSLKTGLPMEECFVFIYNKPYLFYHNNRKFSITFAPTELELVKSPLYVLNSSFKKIEPIKIHAIVKNSEWGFYYPGIFEIECTSIESNLHKKLKPPLSKEDISRLMVYEHELVGYYQEGDLIEIKGLLQKATNVPRFDNLDLHTTYQVLVGGHETFGDEYVRVID